MLGSPAYGRIRTVAGDDLAMALEWIAAGPQFTSISCMVHCRNGSEPQRDQRLIHRMSGHTRVDDLRSGKWTIRTPERWWVGGMRPNEVWTGRETRHGLHIEVEFIIQPTTFIQWASGVTVARPITIDRREGIALDAHWMSTEDLGTPMLMVIEESGLVLAARVPGTLPYPDPWMDFFVDDVVLDRELDDALFQWTADPGVVLRDDDVERRRMVGLVAAASRLPFPLFVPREAPDDVFVDASDDGRGPTAELIVQHPLTGGVYHLVEGAPLLGTRTDDWVPVEGHPRMRCRRRQVPKVSGPSGAESLGDADRLPYQVALQLDGVDIVLAGYCGVDQLAAMAAELGRFREGVIELTEYSP